MPKGTRGRPRGKKCVNYPNLREPDYCKNCKKDAELRREHKRPRGRKCTKEHPADGGGYPAVSAAPGHGGGAGSGAQASPPPSVAASPIASRLKDRGAQRVSERLGGSKYSPQQAQRSYVVAAKTAKGGRRAGRRNKRRYANTANLPTTAYFTSSATERARRRLAAKRRKRNKAMMKTLNKAMLAKLDALSDQVLEPVTMPPVIPEPVVVEPVGQTKKTRRRAKVVAAKKLRKMAAKAEKQGVFVFHGAIRQRGRISRPAMSERSTRRAIQFSFNSLGQPGENKWVGVRGQIGTITEIQRRLLLPESSRRSVRKVLERCVKNKDNPSFDAGGRAAGSGRKRKLDEVEMKIVQESLIRGMGLRNTMHEVNAWRRKRRKGNNALPVVKETIRNARVHSGVKMRRRRKKKSGKKDKGSRWARCRLAQVKQFLLQLFSRSGSRRKGLKRLELDQILFLDEKHFKVILGCLSKWEYLAPLNPDAPQSEWKYPEWKDQTSVKHAKEAHVAG